MSDRKAAYPAFTAPQFLRNPLRRSHPLLPSPFATPIPHRPAYKSRSANPPLIHLCETPQTPDTTSASAPAGPKARPSYRVELLSSVTALSKQEWDRFATTGPANPFVRHDWLRCLEESGCASAATGWTARHVVLREEGRMVAIAPAYVKTHSLGEFVFDHAWADAAYAAGIMYYPKLVVAVPFTPAAGRRVLTGNLGKGEREEVLRVFGRALVRVCEGLGVGSVHVNFCCEDEVEVLGGVGFLLRKGVQYHFNNWKKDGEGGRKFKDFEEYLGVFRSKKRIKMRRERRIVREESGVRIEIVKGEGIDRELMETMFWIYKSTIDKLIYGRQYLSLKFFQMLADCEFKDNICLVLAKNINDGRVVGGTFNIVDGGTFYGRYWGCTEQVRYMHFEVCYYAAIEYCIDNNLVTMEPGAGGGDFKYIRGFQPSVTMSMHYLRDSRLSSAVENFLKMEVAQIDGAVGYMNDQSSIRGNSH